MKSIISFFYFNLNEKKSLTLLLLFIAILFTTSWNIKKRFVPEIVDFSNYDSLFQEIIVVESITTEAPKATKIQSPKILKVKNVHFSNEFTFDPNSVSKDTLQLLGMNAYASNNLIKYREKGGQIKEPEDLKKIYGVTEKMYASIENKIKIGNSSLFSEYNPEPETETNDSSNQFLISDVKELSDLKIKTREEKRILIDLNTADEIQLQYIKGIGPAFANRILKYRELIGGFHTATQLLEVYGLDREKYNEIHDQITISGKVKSMNINTLDYKTLGKHPYISYQEAQLIVAYHKKHGPYKNAYDIVKIGVMDSSFIDRILPYIPDSLINYNAQTPLTSL